MHSMAKAKVTTKKKKKKGSHNIHSLALIKVHIHQCTVTGFTFIQCYTHFSSRSCIINDRVRPLLKVSQ